MEWISVKDKLPEDDEDVIMFVPAKFPFLGRFVLESGGKKGISMGHFRYNATHWTPLPESPKE